MPGCIEDDCTYAEFWSTCLPAALAQKNNFYHFRLAQIIELTSVPLLRDVVHFATLVWCSVERTMVAEYLKINVHATSHGTCSQQAPSAAII
jgi:hypothetical protein